MTDTYFIDIPGDTHLALYDKTEVHPFYEYGLDDAPPEKQEGTETGWSVYMYPRYVPDDMTMAIRVADLPTEDSANDFAWGLQSVLDAVRAAT